MQATAAAPRRDNLALILQEVLTAVVRYRANRQPVTDAESFRYQIREALKTAANEARNVAGYSSDDVKLGIFAVVAFLDESILNSRNPVFADWPRKPMQEEMFGHHIAGEVFFQHLDQLLGRDDSAALADVLEVYYLCLLLGFAGQVRGGQPRRIEDHDGPDGGEDPAHPRQARGPFARTGRCRPSPRGSTRTSGCGAWPSPRSRAWW